MAGDKSKKEPGEEKIVCTNRKARHEYEVLGSLEVGMVLQGTEVKSLRDGRAVLDESYARVEKGEVWLFKSEIPEYRMGNIMNHEPLRKRKLLLHRRQIADLDTRSSERGITLVPLRLYFKDGRAKLELAICRGKQSHDKRESIKERDADRQMRRAVGTRRRS